MRNTLACFHIDAFAFHAETVCYERKRIEKNTVIKIKIMYKIMYN